MWSSSDGVLMASVLPASGAFALFPLRPSLVGIAPAPRQPPVATLPPAPTISSSHQIVRKVLDMIRKMSETQVKCREMDGEPWWCWVARVCVG